MHMLRIVTELPEGLWLVVSFLGKKLHLSSAVSFKSIFAFDAQDGLATSLSGSLGFSELWYPAS